MNRSSAETATRAPHPAATTTNRVLLVSYHFPPVGGAGVQRPVKFVKYLRKYGWDTSVLTAANPSAPVFDESLCADLPDDLIVAKARTWEPNYGRKKQFLKIQDGTTRNHGHARRLRTWLTQVARNVAQIALQPDPQVLWLPNAYRTGCELLQQLPHTAILATAPSFTNLLVGALLKRKFGLPLLIDYRDEWDLSSQYWENRQRDRISHWVQERMQRWVLRHADRIIATTKASAQRLLSRAQACGSKATARCIYNGFDASDFQASTEIDGTTELVPQSSRPPASRRYHLVYTGTLWNLTTIEPIVRAIELLEQRAPEYVSRLEFTVVGRKTPEQRALLQRLSEISCVVNDRDYCDHRAALSLLRDADGLCLLLSDVPGADRVVPAKLFEYLAMGTPILAVTPNGETAGIVREFFPTSHFVPSDVAGIAAWLEQRLRETDGPADPRPRGNRSPGVWEYSREVQAGQLAEELDAMVGRLHG